VYGPKAYTYEKTQEPYLQRKLWAYEAQLVEQYQTILARPLAVEDR